MVRAIEELTMQEVVTVEEPVEERRPQAGSKVEPIPFQGSSKGGEEPVAVVKGVSKRYTLWGEPIDRLRAPLLRGAARSSFLPGSFSSWLGKKAEGMAREFRALSDVSFELKRGESLGIIGRNGAGKSTLLQIMAGTLRPTSGSAKLRGRVSALLELGSGFNAEFTGRENVLLQAALAGASRGEVEERFDEVLAFANIGDFVDQPVKVYSTGMLLRLAFATETILEPDVFLVDEALAVGDVFFISKCTRFFEERLAAGMSLILVSHDISAVKALCQRALVLDEGVPRYLGDCTRAESIFHELHEAALRKAHPVIDSGPSDQSARLRNPETGLTLPDGAGLRNWPEGNEIGSREAEIVYSRVTDAKGNPRLTFFQGESIRLDLYLQAKVDLDRCHFSIQVSDSYNNVVYGVSTINLRRDPQDLKAGELRRWRVEFKGLGLGQYLVDALLFLGDRGDGCPVHHVHRVGGIATISVGQRGQRPDFVGMADLRAAMEFK